MVMLTEIQLVEGCRKGDPIARRQLYERYSRTLYAVCCRYAKDRDMAQDLMHDGFIVILTKIGEFRGEGSLEGWCRRVMVNSVLGYLRKNNPLNQCTEVETMVQVKDGGADVVSKMSNDDLMDCIAELSDGYRTILNLYAVEGYSHKEIGETMNISEATSRSQYSRARARLVEMLEKRGINDTN